MNDFVEEVAPTCKKRWLPGTSEGLFWDSGKMTLLMEAYGDHWSFQRIEANAADENGNLLSSFSLSGDWRW